MSVADDVSVDLVRSDEFTVFPSERDDKLRGQLRVDPGVCGASKFCPVMVM